MRHVTVTPHATVKSRVTVRPHEAAPEERTPRMPKAGPNIPCPAAHQADPQFGGDIAMRELRRRLALEPDVVPPPPIMVARDSGFRWLNHFGMLLLAAGLASFAITFLATSEWRRPVREEFKLVSATSAPAAPRQEPARLVVEDGKVPANEPLPLTVSLQGAAGGEFILLSGLAAGTRLTAGAPFGNQGWRLMARDLTAVAAFAPRDYVGTMDAAVDLRSSNDALLDSQVVRLEWVPVAAPREPGPLRPKMTPLEPDAIANLIRRGEQLLRTGDIASARLLLRRAAEAGSATAALGVGATFDPAVLRQMGVLGFAPNVGQARHWYERAVELGSTEAARRIERLPAQAK
jgi:hypothetical protein